MAKTWTWISGWAIDPKQLKAAVERAIPDYLHKVLAPAPDALEVVIASGADRIGGYSLGSLILLSGLEQIPKTATIVCLAPFIAFCKEDLLGGATPRATLDTLRQRLKKQPQKTLQLFYRLAGLSDPVPDHLPYPIDSLEWGLNQLAVLKANTTALNRVRGVVGLTDPLLDVKTIKSVWPTCYLVNECNHDYHKLLVAVSQMDFI